MAVWQEYLQDTGHAIQKGLESGLHILEGGLAVAGTIKGVAELGSQIAPYIRGAAVAAPAAVALL